MATTTHVDITEGLLAYLQTNLTAIDAGYTAAKDVAWPNVEFASDGLDDWMAVAIEFTAARPAELGGSARKIEGNLNLFFFTRPIQGPDELAARIDAAHDLFKSGTTITENGLNIRMRTPAATPIDPNVAEWGRQALICPFIVYT